MNDKEFCRKLNESFERICLTLKGAMDAMTEAFKAYDKATKPEKLNQSQASAVIRCWVRDMEDKL